MLTRNDILIKLKELKPTLNKDYSVKNIGLFGSFSNGDYTNDSDIDLLVELEKPIGWKFILKMSLAERLIWLQKTH